MSIRFASALCAAHLVAVAGICSAQDGAAPQPLAAASLPLAAAVEQALAGNPDLRSFMYRLRAQQARGETAALKPPLELRAEVEDVFGTGRASGVGIGEGTLSISQVVELGAKRARRVEVTEAGWNLLDVERAAAQLDVLAEVTRRFVHVAADQQQLELTERATELAGETLIAVQTRVAAARAPEVELRRVRIALARAQIEQEHAEHELLSSRRRLAAMWGDSEPTFGAVEADLYRLPGVESFEALLSRLRSNPDFVRFASEARLRDAEIRLAQSQARADIALTAGLRRLQQTRDHAFVLGVTVPLASAARSRGAIAEATALRGQTDAELDAHRVRAEAQLFALYQEFRHSITEADTLRAEVLPEMEAALAATREAYERGRYSYLEWVDAQREFVAIQRALIEASANAHLFQTELERLTGEALLPANQ
jgi:cobalt-zinc-cadmium efflux system outer membrane protein